MRKNNVLWGDIQYVGKRPLTIGEIKSIIRLSNYGEKEKPIWKLLAKTDWKKITTPGRYIIK